jgi:hypothetical protein
MPTTRQHRKPDKSNYSVYRLVGVQLKFPTKVWTGVIVCLLPHSYELRPRLSRASYLQFLSEQLTHLLRIYNWQRGMMGLQSILLAMPAVFRQLLPMSMDRTKRSHRVASAITRSHSCRHTLAGPSEVHRSQPTELWNAIEAAGTTISYMPDVISADQEFLAQQGSAMPWL